MRFSSVQCYQFENDRHEPTLVELPLAFKTGTIRRSARADQNSCLVLHAADIGGRVAPFGVRAALARSAGRRADLRRNSAQPAERTYLRACTGNGCFSNVDSTAGVSAVPGYVLSYIRTGQFSRS